MSQRTQPQVVRSYLDELEDALAGLPVDIAREVIDGVTEELASLDAKLASARIQELGDPIFIAAQARAESGHEDARATTGREGTRADNVLKNARAASETEEARAVSNSTAPALAKGAPIDAETQRCDLIDASRLGAASGGDPRWYTVIASLLVSFGGLVVPVLGWLFGLAMVWMSKTWRAWEKWVATLTAPLVSALAVFVVRWISVSGSGAGDVPGVGSINPLIPTVYDTWWSGFILLVFLNAVVGLWLLWRGLRTGR